jgi:hypothetical protein
MFSEVIDIQSSGVTLPRTALEFYENVALTVFVEIELGCVLALKVVDVDKQVAPLFP